MNNRIGFGYDVHKLREGLAFWLGGIRIQHPKGAEGHSDADVLIHAICDALLGAANLRDIGYNFPDTSKKYKGIDSKILLEKVMRLLAENNYRIGNIDVTVCLQRPKISDYIPEMIKILAETMDIKPGCLSIKATTSEGLGFTGREEGIAAYAIALIFKK